ncbi:MAG: carbamoyltransferase HypF [Lachnospiraceae bacterium]|nr:carbamoyltransferase HypF [Lachnospiraceae bacterium]
MPEHKSIRLYGIVQGVGFRPFVHRLALREGIRGYVANMSSCVEIEAEGSPAALDRFIRALTDEAPERAVIVNAGITAAACVGYDDFRIVESRPDSGDIFVSPDIAVCPECLRELYTPSDRRFGHPFINCTACGPRLTILKSMPYDRPGTSMGAFPMCPACFREYTDPTARRYHAQPVACPDCGPTLYCLDGRERGAEGHEALLAARSVIARGGIAAVKGIGGFHLCCDAENDDAVRRLRKLKQRPSKPFAVMAADIEAAFAVAETDEDAVRILDGPEKPILLLKKKPGSSLSPAVAPGNPRVGLMLPYTPLHALLFHDPRDLINGDRRVLVMTSANPPGQPICRTDEAVLAWYGGICDIILSHDREILTAADDSVMTRVRGEVLMIRRSRGYAPLPVASRVKTGALTDCPEEESADVLAMGGELKNAFCLGNARYLYPSAYLSDMTDVRSLEALETAIGHMSRLLHMSPSVIAVDKHPRYAVSALGRRMAGDRGLPVIEIQHHFAHMVSVMAENHLDEMITGAVFDGTGYGDDGTVWGGEFLTGDRRQYVRRGCLHRLYLAGGDSASREGWRSACAWLYDALGEEAGPLCRKLQLASDEAAAAQLAMTSKHFGGIMTSSGGRLFDAASAILGLCRVSTFEGEAAMALQFAAQTYRENHTESLADPSLFTCRRTNLSDESGREGDFFEMDPSALLCRLAEGRLRGEDPRYLAALFHDTMALLIAEGVSEASQAAGGIKKAALSGGVMVNDYLAALISDRLTERGFDVYTHHMIPPGDNGLALGQAAAALALIRQR